MRSMCPLGDSPTQVIPNLEAQQIDSQQRLEESWGEVRDHLTELFDWSGLKGIEAEELTVFPGMDELFSLATVRDHARSGEYDVIIVDCAPTAETLRLLSLPEVMSWYMDKMFPISRKVAKVVRPVISRVSTIPFADEAVFDAVSRFYDRLDGDKGDPVRSRGDDRQACDEPRKDGDLGGQTNLYVPWVVRLLGRLCDREPHPAERRV